MFVIAVPSGGLNLALLRRVWEKRSAHPETNALLLNAAAAAILATSGILPLLGVFLLKVSRLLLSDTLQLGSQLTPPDDAVWTAQLCSAALPPQLQRTLLPLSLRRRCLLSQPHLPRLPATRRRLTDRSTE